MDKKEFKYDAFISYRHCELDKFVAENLHRVLETYDLPKEIKKKLNIKDKAFKRVFRDQEELPLTSNLEDPIIEALENSKYLIVICSPRLKDSLWCKKEIETFKKLRGRKNIFCVLIEGEPSESFPEAVTFDYVEKEINGKTKKEKILVEPLAADIRGKSKRDILKKLKEEKLRLIAPMYNLDYDDLRQRHKIWKQKHMIHVSLGIAAAAILFLIYSLIMIIKINLQQNILAEYHALSLVDQAENYLKKDDRYNAVKSSYQAITDFYDVVMPYTPEAEYMLTESLGVYDAGLSFKAIDGLYVDGVIDYIKTSPSHTYGLIYDESEKLTLFNTSTLDKISSYEVSSYNEYEFSFINDDTFSFITKDGNINIVNTSDGKTIKVLDKKDNSYKALVGNDKYLAYVDEKNLYIYNIEEDKVSEIMAKESYMKELYFREDSKYLFAFTEEKNYDINKQDHLTIHTIDVSNGKEINKVTIDAGYISGVQIIDNNAYFLFNDSVGIKYNMVLVSYNYINGNINYIKVNNNLWGKFIKRSYPDSNHLVLVNYDTVNIFNTSNGEFIESYSTGEEIINIYSYTNKELYLVFLGNGKVNYINTESKNTIEYMGKYEFNLDNYNEVVQTENGFLLVPTNENRVILYEQKANPDVEVLDITLDYIKDDSIPSKDYDKVKEEYDVKNKSLVSKIFYGRDEEILFVNYTNGDISIYDVKTKKLLKSLTNVGKVYHYFGEDKYGRLYIGDISNSYILDDEYNKVGHIKGLAKLENDKVIITSDKKYYSIKIYNLKELKNMADKYLGDFENIEE